MVDAFETIFIGGCIAIGLACLAFLIFVFKLWFMLWFTGGLIVMYALGALARA